MEKKKQHTLKSRGIVGLMIPLFIMIFLIGCGDQSSLTPAEGPTSATPEGLTPTITASPAPTATLAPTQELPAGSARTREIDNMVMLYVPAGEFLMGSSESDPQAAYDEFPQHKIILDGFWIDRTEVTNGMYAKCVLANACELPMETFSSTRESYYGNPDYADYPVIFVKWQYANDYCQWAGVRLPSEAEWEKSARGEAGSLYPWGDEFDCHNGNFDDEVIFDEPVVPGGPDCDGYEESAPVGSFPSGASPYGALDMAGNVWEWVSSNFLPYPYNAEDGREDFETRALHTIRGGAAGSTEDRIRSAARTGYPFPKNYHIQFGFRCAD